MRIVLLAELDYFGGTRTYFKALVQLLVQNGHEVIPLVMGPPNDPDMTSFLKSLVPVWRNIPFRKKWAYRTGVCQLWELSFFLRAIVCHKPDAIVTSSGGWWGSAFLLPIPVLSIWHSLPSDPGRLKRAIFSWLYSRFSQRHRLLTVSRFAASQIERNWNVTAEVIHNMTLFPDAVQEPPQIDNMRVITCGHVVNYKNPGIWIQVARKVLAEYPEATFTWYGDGPLLEEMRAQAGSDARIYFAGFSDDLSAIYRQAAVYFQPSLSESHGISVVDAMSHGLPCVVSNCGGLPESVDQGKTGFLAPPCDINGFVMGICTLLGDASLRFTMGRAGQKKVARCFMPEKWAAETIQIINKMFVNR